MGHGPKKSPQPGLFQLYSKNADQETRALLRCKPILAKQPAFFAVNPVGKRFSYGSKFEFRIVNL
jgi:hypothetical protein